MRNFEQAMTDLNESIRIGGPDNAFAYATRGRVWIKKNNLDNALADFDKAIKLEPTAPTLYIARGDAWARTSQTDSAIADYTKAIELGMRSPHAFAGRGFQWAQKGEHDSAIADYSEAIRLAPGSKEVYCIVAWPILKRRITIRPSPILIA